MENILLIASHQAELRREEKFTDQKSLNISFLKSDYLNLDSSSSGSSRHNERAHSVQAKCTFLGGNNHSEAFFQKVDEKARAFDVSSNRNSEHPPQKCFRCGSEDHIQYLLPHGCKLL